jgi:predicted alpha/beta superfamily hydrolase
VSTPFDEDRFEVHSTETGFDYEICVEVPNRYRLKPDARFPVVVCLDGLWTYGAVRDAFRILPLSKELPEAVVVGVGHAASDMNEVLQLRAVDYTPTRFAAPAETGVRISAREVGRADAFRRFLVDTLLPLLGARYRISDDRTLVGHSFSGLFGVDTLLVEPDAFDRWVLTSPSLWWDDRIMLKREAAHAAATDDIDARVFLSLGGDETTGGFGGQREFYEQLAARQYRSLDLHWLVFPGETHQSVISAAVVRGLRAVNATASV